MAEAILSDQSSLKDAILQVWRPAVGEQSLQRLWSAILMDMFNMTYSENMISPLTNFNASVEAYLSSIIEKFTNFHFLLDVTKYFDSHKPFQLEDALVSGSWSEGLFIYFENSAETTLPDLDFMCVLKNIKFTITDQLNGNLTVQEDTPFVNAYITDEGSAKLWKDFLHDSSHDHLSNKHQISSMKLKEKLISQNLSNVKRNFKGIFDNVQLSNVDCEPESAAFTVTCEKPAAATAFDNTDSIRSFLDAFKKNQSKDYFSDEVIQYFNMMNYKLLPSCDIVLALSCDGWPLCAREWITRERIWPGDDLVKTITQNGFHIVPKRSQRKGDFRLSFSVAETTLIKHLSPLQHKVVKCFKGVVKYHQNSWSANFKKIVKTYHLKTIAFWHCETTTPDSFTEESVDLHLVLLLQELAEALRKQELPMYFMPKVNLFQEVENSDEVIDVVEKIIKISCNYTTLTQAVKYLAKLDLRSAMGDFWTDVLIQWKNLKTPEYPKIENQKLCTIDSPGIKLMCLCANFFQMPFVQPHRSHDDGKEMDYEWVRFIQSYLDIAASIIPRSPKESKK